MTKTEQEFIKAIREVLEEYGAKIEWGSGFTGSYTEDGFLLKNGDIVYFEEIFE